MLEFLLVPALIYLARIVDVSLGTIRIILVGKGYRLHATLLGFLEVLVWIVAIGGIIANLDNLLNYLAYAAGFATGTFVGMLIESRMSIGRVVVRIITRRDDGSALLDRLLSEPLNVTAVDAEGRTGAVKILFLVMRRRDLRQLVKLIDEYNPKAFYTVEDVRFVRDAYNVPLPHPYLGRLRNLKRALAVRK